MLATADKSLKKSLSVNVCTCLHRERWSLTDPRDSEYGYKLQRDKLANTQKRAFITDFYPVFHPNHLHRCCTEYVLSPEGLATPDLPCSATLRTNLHMSSFTISFRSPYVSDRGCNEHCRLSRTMAGPVWFNLDVLLYLSHHLLTDDFSLNLFRRACEMIVSVWLVSWIIMFIWREKLMDWRKTNVLLL